MLQVAIIPSDPKDIYSFLTPLLNELKILETFGMTVHCADGTFRLKSHALLASRDVVGVQQLIHHTVHQSEYGCRQCRIKSVSALSPNGKGNGRYYQSNATLDSARTPEEFIHGNTVQYTE